MTVSMEEEFMARRADESGNPNESQHGAQTENRDKYRDNDDVRAPQPADHRVDTKSDSRSEARGDARENVGDNARGTDAHPTGPEGNDRTRR
jgi:hypothetical protein